MTIPFNPVEVRPQVITLPAQQGGGDFADALLRAMIAAQQDARAREQLGLERGRESRISAEAAQRMTAENATGDALLNYIMAGGRQEQAQMTDVMRRMVAGATNQPFAATAPVPMQMAGPMGALAGAIPQNVQGAAVTPYVQATIPLQQMAEGRRREASRLEVIERALGTIGDPMKREAMRGYVTFTEMGGSLSDDMKRQLWPQLGELQDKVEPSRLAVANDLWRSGVPTLADAYEAAGIPRSMAGRLSGEKFPVPAQSGGGVEAQKAIAHARTMIETNAVINGLEGDGRRISLLAQYVKENRKGGILRGLANSALDKETQQLVTAQAGFADAFRFAVSGAASSEPEYANIINYLTAGPGDNAVTIQQKRALREAVVQGVLDRAGGKVTPSQMVQGLLLRSDLSKQQRGWLENQLQDAKKYEDDLRRGVVRISADDTPVAPESLGASVTNWSSVIDQALGVRPAPTNPTAERMARLQQDFDKRAADQRTRRDSARLGQLIPGFTPVRP